MAISLTGLVFRLQKGSPLSSVEGDANLRRIRDFANAIGQLFGVVLKNDGTLRDGAVGSTAVLADGVVTAAKLAADAKFPSGALISFGGTIAPAGWLLCDGSTVSRTTYAALFAAIGITWGPGDGATTFTLPDMRRRVPVGSGGAGTSDLGNTVGNVGGEEKHLLLSAESGVAVHHHSAASGTVRWEGGGVTGGIGGSAMTIVGNFANQDAVATDAAQSHNNFQPSAVVLCVIKT